MVAVPRKPSQVSVPAYSRGNFKQPDWFSWLQVVLRKPGTRVQALENVLPAGIGLASGKLLLDGVARGGASR